MPTPPENYSITAARHSVLDPGGSTGQAGTGPVTLQISGAQFASATTFQLRNAQGTVINATRTLLQDSATAFATFDLTGQALGPTTSGRVQSDRHATKLAGA